MHPVLISIGPKKLESDVIQKAITLKEKSLGRPLNSTEILQTVGECYEPEESKRLFLSARPPNKMPRLHLPDDLSSL